jgi:NDP-sugar pyrophosphorylase family protein
MNGDVLTDLNFSDFYNFHIKSNNIFTVSSYRREHINDYGVLQMDENGLLCGFQEKPKICFEVSMGIYMANKQILEIIPSDVLYGFDHLMLELIKRKTPATVKNHNGYWLDIGRPDDYHIAIENDRNLFLI